MILHRIESLASSLIIFYDDYHWLFYKRKKWSKLAVPQKNHNLSTILSCGRQFEASYVKYILRNWRAQSFHDAGLPRQSSMGANVQNSMDRFGPTGKVSKKRVHLLRWTTFPGRTGWNFVWMDRAPRFKNILSHSLENSRLLRCCCCCFRIRR